MDRRKFLQVAAAAGVALMVPFGRKALRADAARKYDGPYYLLIHAGGGWDPTFFCDPKGDDTDKLYKSTDIGTSGKFKFAPLQYKDDQGKVIYTNEQFFTKHGSKVLVINGVDTTTGNHDTGTRVTWSGKIGEGHPTFAALVAGARSPGNALGFISNGGYEQTAGLAPLTRLGSVGIVTRIAYPDRIDPAKGDYLYHTQATQDRILRMQRERLDDLRSAQSLPRLQRATSSLYLSRGGDNDLVQLAQQLPPQAVVDAAWNPLHRQALVAIAGFKSGVAVAANLTIGGFDTHGDHDNAHSRAMRDLVWGVDLILDELDKQGLSDKVVLAVGSDFGRTPLYNAQNGKDHWNITSMLFAGPGIPGGKVIGGTTDVGYKAWTVNPTSLASDASGIRIRPEHIHRSLRKLAQIDDTAQAKAFPILAEDLPLFA